MKIQSYQWGWTRPKHHGDASMLCPKRSSHWVKVTVVAQKKLLAIEVNPIVTIPILAIVVAIPKWFFHRIEREQFHDDSCLDCSIAFPLRRGFAIIAHHRRLQRGRGSIKPLSLQWCKFHLQDSFCLIFGRCQDCQPFWSPQWRIVTVKSMRMCYNWLYPFKFLVNLVAPDLKKRSNLPGATSSKPPLVAI